MVQLIVNNNIYSHIVSPKSVIKLTSEEKSKLEKNGTEKLTYLHNLLCNSDASSVSFGISPRHGCYDFAIVINDTNIYIKFCKNDKCYRLILATFKNPDKFTRVNFDVQLFSDFLEDYPYIEKTLKNLLKAIEERKGLILSKVGEVGKKLGLSEPVKIAVNEELEPNVSVSQQEETKQKVGEIHVNGQVIKIITDDEITVVKPKQKSLGSGKNG